ncbi:hypothetical protein [Roseivirga pacifica]|uniref:hypothetical protein n=1 Tax=Roseivirga pacifica TaxID=1267423 RepID=UPI00227A623B|nr:hypothetical protein [Roseivirga pacifica]
MTGLIDSFESSNNEKERLNNSLNETNEILSLPGLDEYIEDMAWTGQPDKCSPENFDAITTALMEKVNGREEIISAIRYERENGRGSLKRLEEDGLERAKKSPANQRLLQFLNDQISGNDYPGI